MMIRQHIPSFVDGVTAQRAEFETLEELLALGFVRRWSEPAEQFNRYSYAPGRGRGDLLMAEMADGKWWVIGYLEREAGARLGLPEWKSPNEREARG